MNVVNRAKGLEKVVAKMFRESRRKNVWRKSSQELTVETGAPGRK